MTKATITAERIDRVFWIDCNRPGAEIGCGPSFTSSEVAEAKRLMRSGLAIEAIDDDELVATAEFLLKAFDDDPVADALKRIVTIRRLRSSEAGHE